MKKLQKNKFKILFLIISFALIPSLKVYAEFSDVGGDATYYEATEYLKNKGIINGYQDGTFKPSNAINRAEALKIILLANQIVSPGTLTATIEPIDFPDVNNKDWFFEFVQTAFSNKIVEGYGDGTFKPENTINAAESLKMILTTFKVDLSSYQNVNPPFSDVKPGDWFLPYMAYAKEKKFIEANEDGSFGPGRNMTRSEFAEIIYRMLYVTENKLSEFPISINWPGTNDTNGAFSIKYPPDWQVIKGNNQLIFWKQDLLNKQVSFSRSAPNSAVITITTDTNSNKLSLTDYVTALNYPGTVQRQDLTLNNMPFVMVNTNQNGQLDYYFQLPDQSIVLMYAQIGDGSLNDKLKEELRYMAGSLTAGKGVESVITTPNTNTNIITPPNDKDLTLSKIREKILLTSQGKAAIQVLTDAFIFDTDSIGVGTGPIDYYYSPSFDVSLKYERNSDTLLGLKAGKTTAL